MTKEKRIGEAIDILTQLGLPREQLNERTAICLLALLDLKVDSPWSKATSPMLGIRAILDFARTVFGRNYAENTRETVRDESIKPMLAAGLLQHNPDQPDRAVNSPKNCYQIDEHALALLRTYGSKQWKTRLRRSTGSVASATTPA
jgi:adenine-specific DNA-methyltransferase